MALASPSRRSSSSPAWRRRPVVAVFGAWNAAIWLARIRNIAADASLDTAGKLAWTLPALVFGIGGLVALAAWGTGRPALLRLTAVVVVATVLYWPVRTVMIAFGDHPAGFVVVHLVLAVVSVGLALAVGRSLWRAKLIPGASGR